VIYPVLPDEGIVIIWEDAEVLLNKTSEEFLSPDGDEHPHKRIATTT
jgi:hypothetical protein